MLSYHQIRECLVATLGPPGLKFCFYGQPRGFTASRHVGGASVSALRSKAWAKAFRLKFIEETRIPYLVATKDKHMYFYTAAWYQDGRHCDPENTHKLVKDALFYNTPKLMGAADKFTGGSYAGPMYDKENPRTEMLIWDK